MSRQSAKQVCQDNFGNGKLLEITSQEEFDAAKEFIEISKIATEIQIGDTTLPSSRGIGQTTLYEYGKYYIWRVYTVYSKMYPSYYIRKKQTLIFDLRTSYTNL